MGRLTGHHHKRSGSFGKIEVVTQAIGSGHASSGPAAAIPVRASTPNSSCSIRRRPSLIFAEDNSESDDLTGRFSGDRRRCSFVSSGDGPAEVMDLRMLDSEHGGRSSYDLSVCSGSSFETLRTNDAAMEKMGNFEVALTSGLKKAATAVKKKETSDHSCVSDDEDKFMGSIIKALVTRSRRLSTDRRVSMETIWSSRERRPMPTGYSPSTDSQDPIVDIVAKKVLEDNTSTRRKVYVRRCVQAAAIFVSLSLFVASIIYFEMEDTNPSSLISSFATKTTSMLEGLFGPPGETEAQREQVADEPSAVTTGGNARRHRVMEENRLRKERVARNRQARIEAHEKNQG
ncbi:hypothetical protein ACHAXM_007588 [Skeletonema potamos]